MENLNAIRAEAAPPLGGDHTAQDELRAKFHDGKRKERVKNVMNWVFIGFIIVASMIAVSVIAIRLIHLVLPAKQQWLTVDQIQGIDKLFFSGAIGGFLVNYFKRTNE